jgi:hypothetical protein
MTTCTNTNNEVREFSTYDEAMRFVGREAEFSRLWSIEGAVAEEMRIRRAEEARKAW